MIGIKFVQNSQEETKGNQINGKQSNSHEVTIQQQKINNYSHQDLLAFFQNYPPQNVNVEMEKLRNSEQTQLRKYKENIYYGELLDGKRNGKGIMVYNINHVYEGDWKDGSKCGYGLEKFDNGCFYEGLFKNGRPEGFGKYIWPNGELYEGQWEEGIKHGSGMWRGSKGDSYIGEWKNGKADGYGVHTWINGDKYEGQFRQSLKYGEGIQKFANGDLYKGSYEKGKPSGYGEYFWSNGSFFKGNFQNGFRQGQGVWKKAEGNSDQYEGQYKKDKKCGFGVFKWTSGNIYKGEYQNDLRNGIGEMFWGDGSFYKGQWKKGIQHGKGQIFMIGEGYKRGIFQDNVLIVLQFQSETVPKATNQNEFERQSMSMMSSKTSRLKGSSGIKFNIRCQYPLQKNKSVCKSVDSKSVSQSSHMQKTSRINLPKKNQSFILNSYPRKEQRYSKKPLLKVQLKQRFLHSSFYLHKIHSKDRTKINSFVQN